MTFKSNRARPSLNTRYLNRIVDAELEELLPQLPVISLEGPKGVGKTETAKRRASTIYELDEPADKATPVL